MTPIHRFTVVSLAILLVRTAAAFGEPQPTAPQPAPTSPTGDMNAALSAEVEKPMALTDAQVRAFLDASDDLRAQQQEPGASATPAPTPRNALDFAGGVNRSEKTAEILTKHGFKDLTEFQRVGFNTAMAYNLLRQGGKEAIRHRVDKARAAQKETIERLRSQLTAEQIKMVETQGEQSLRRAQVMYDIPDGNVEIVKKYESRLSGSAAPK